MSTCEICKSKPGIAIAARRHVGMVVMQRFVKASVIACPDCGKKLLRGFTARTLVQGWWGVISFFANLFVLAANGYHTIRLSRFSETAATTTAFTTTDG